MLILSICLAVGASIVAKAETNLFPIGEFTWPAEDCNVSSGTKDGKYKCAMFLKLKDNAKRNFFFHYGDYKPNIGECTISLDSENKFKDAKHAVKLNFDKIKTKFLHRISFLVKPNIVMKKDKQYEARVYIKSENPGQKLAISLMGLYKKANSDKKRMNYKFYKFTTSTMWQPFTVKLSLNSRKDAISSDITSIVIDAQTAGTFYVGKIVLVEKALEK